MNSEYFSDLRRQHNASVMPASSAIKPLIAKVVFRGADAPLQDPGSGPG